MSFKNNLFKETTDTQTMLSDMTTLFSEDDIYDHEDKNHNGSKHQGIKDFRIPRIHFNMKTDNKALRNKIKLNPYKNFRRINPTLYHDPILINDNDVGDKEPDSIYKQYMKYEQEISHRRKNEVKHQYENKYSNATSHYTYATPSGINSSSQDTVSTDNGSPPPPQLLSDADHQIIKEYWYHDIQPDDLEFDDSSDEDS